MATKPQAKAAIDSTVVLVKADIDNVLPVGVNIRRGSISFGPMGWTLIVDAGGSPTVATDWANTIIANLAGRNPVLSYRRRADDQEPERVAYVTGTNVNIRIVNF